MVNPGWSSCISSPEPHSVHITAVRDVCLRWHHQGKFWSWLGLNEVTIWLICLLVLPIQSHLMPCINIEHEEWAKGNVGWMKSQTEREEWRYNVDDPHYCTEKETDFCCPDVHKHLECLQLRLHLSFEVNHLLPNNLQIYVSAYENHIKLTI